MHLLLNRYIAMLVLFILCYFFIYLRYSFIYVIYVVIYYLFMLFVYLLMLFIYPNNTTGSELYTTLDSPVIFVIWYFIYEILIFNCSKIFEF
jgi:hypothetical protein